MVAALPRLRGLCCTDDTDERRAHKIERKDMRMQAKYEPIVQQEDSLQEMETRNSMEHQETSRCAFAVSSCKVGCGLLSHFLVYFLGILSGKIMSMSTHEYTLRCDSIAYGFLNTPRGHDLIDDLTSIMVRDGQVSALSTMEQMMNEDDSVNDACHETLHKLATNTWRHQKLVSTQQATTHEQYETVLFDEFIGTPEEERLRLCGAGYLHGIVERGLLDFAYLEDGEMLASSTMNMTLEEDWDRLESEVSWLGENICGQIMESENDDTYSNRWECQHGLGHGTLQNRRQVYRRIALRESLQLCLEAEHVDASTCQDGVWMEYWTEVGLTMDEDLDDPAKNALAVCDQVPEQVSGSACPFYAATSYLIRHPRDYQRAMENFCRNESTGASNGLCIQGVGMLAAKQNKDSFVPLEEVCLLAPNLVSKMTCFSAGVIYTQNSFHAAGGTLPSYLCDDLLFFGMYCKEFANGSS